MNTGSYWYIRPRTVKLLCDASRYVCVCVCVCEGACVCVCVSAVKSGPLGGYRFAPCVNLEGRHTRCGAGECMSKFDLIRIYMYIYVYIKNGQANNGTSLDL